MFLSTFFSSLFISIRSKHILQKIKEGRKGKFLFIFGWFDSWSRGETNFINYMYYVFAWVCAIYLFF